MAGKVAALFFIPEGFQVLWFWANENEGRRTASAGEVGAFGEKPAPWMYGVATGLHRERQQTVDVEVSGGTGHAKRQAAIGGTRVQAAGVVARLHSYGFETKVVRSPGDADSNFAAIRDQDPAQDRSLN